MDSVEVMVNGEADRRSPVGDAKLFVDRVQVRFDGMDTESEPIRYFLVGQPRCHKAQHNRLPPGQLHCRVIKRHSHSLHCLCIYRAGLFTDQAQSNTKPSL